MSCISVLLVSPYFLHLAFVASVHMYLEAQISSGVDLRHYALPSYPGKGHALDLSVTKFGIFAGFFMGGDHMGFQRGGGGGLQTVSA